MEPGQGGVDGVAVIGQQAPGEGVQGALHPVQGVFQAGPRLTQGSGGGVETGYRLVPDVQPVAQGVHGVAQTAGHLLQAAAHLSQVF